MAIEGRKRVLKWIGIGFGSLLGILILAAVLVPLFVDVDKFRPKIEQAAEEHINGKLEIGKLALSLWGQIKVTVDGFRLLDSKGQAVISAKDVYFHVPFWSLLSGSPRVTFHLAAPAVNVVKDKKGNLNVTSLMKEAPTAPAEAPEAETGGTEGLPGFVTKARLGIEMRGATLAYTDAATGLESKVSDLNVVAKDLSLSSPSQVEVWANLDTKMGETLTVKGPARLTMSAKPETSGGKLQRADAEFRVDLGDLVIVMPGTFRKDKGIEAWATGKLTVTPERAVCEKLDLRFHNAAVSGRGEVSGLARPPMVVSVNLEAPGIAIAPWKKLIEPLAPYDITGDVSLKASAKGPMEKLDYFADLRLKNAVFSGAQLKQKATLNGAVVVRPNQVETISFKMEAPGNDLRINGSLASFEAPRLKLAIASSGLDLDKLLVLPEPPKDGGAKAGTAQQPAADYDAMVAPVREMDLMKRASGDVSVDIRSLRFMNVVMSGIKSKMALKALNFQLASFGMGIFDGTVTASGNVSLAQKTPGYNLTTAVKSVDLQKAVTSQFAPFKNTLVGKGFFDMKLTGRSFNPPAAKANLSATGKMRIDHARFNTIDVGRVATEAINKAMSDLASKVPELRGKTVNAPKNVASKYESVTGSFTIGGGEMRAPDFFARAVPNEGLDISGNTRVNLVNDALAADWELRDPHNVLKARDLSVTVAGTTVPHILTRDNTLVLPVEVRGTVVEPKISYASVPEALAKVALNNIKKAAESRVKQEAQKAVKKEAEKVLKKGLKGLFK